MNVRKPCRPLCKARTAPRGWSGICLSGVRLEGEALRADGGDPAAPLNGTDLSATARQLLADLAPRAQERQQVLQLDTPGPVLVPMPAALVQVLLRNLIDNALRYSPAAASVHVTVRGATAEVAAQVVVEDSGPGLPPEAQARLGERFTAYWAADRREVVWGWSIVRRVARLYGIGIFLASQPRFGGAASGSVLGPKSIRC